MFHQINDCYCWSWVKVSFHFYIPKFLKVPVDKRNNTLQNLRGVINTPHRDSTWPSQFWFIWQTRKPGHLEALKNSPHMHPLMCRRVPTVHFPLDCGQECAFTCFFTCFFKKNKSNMLCRSWRAQCNFFLAATPDCKKVKPLYVLLMLASGQGPRPAMLCKRRSPRGSGPRVGAAVIARSQQFRARQGSR